MNKDCKNIYNNYIRLIVEQQQPTIGTRVGNVIDKGVNVAQNAGQTVVNTNKAIGNAARNVVGNAALGASNVLNKAGNYLTNNQQQPNQQTTQSAQTTTQPLTPLTQEYLQTLNDDQLKNLYYQKQQLLNHLRELVNKAAVHQSMPML